MAGLLLGMRNSVALTDGRTEQVNDWLLAILRYSVTLHDVDKSSVLVAARTIDKLGSHFQEHTAFEFFERTSIELCSAIFDVQNAARSAALRLHIKRIDDPRLRRAFEAAIDVREPRSLNAQKCRKRSSHDLWKGLRP
jgi:hypothetical protein